MTCVLAGLVGLATGCVERRVVYVPTYQAQPGSPPPAGVPGPADTSAPPANAVATQAPPAPQVEVVPVAPGPDYDWVPGYWYWGGTTWVWLGGRWTVRPWHGAVWVRGGWYRHGRGWAWHGGHWR